MTPFIQFLSPAICAACNMLGGIGVGYAYHDVGASLNWTYRQMASGHVDYDTLAYVASYRAYRRGQFSIGPYLGRTFNLDGKTGGNHDPAIIGGLQISWSFR